MAATITPTTTMSGRDMQIVKWAAFDAGDTLVPWHVGAFSKVTVCFVKGSAFGGNAGAEISAGLITDTSPTYFVPLDTAGNAISGKTADGAFTLLTNANLFRPTAASGVENVECYLILKK